MGRDDQDSGQFVNNLHLNLHLRIVSGLPVIQAQAPKSGVAASRLDCRTLVRTAEYSVGRVCGCRRQDSDTPTANARSHTAVFYGPFVSVSTEPLSNRAGVKADACADPE